jgi:hypothetical protein
MYTNISNLQLTANLPYVNYPYEYKYKRFYLDVLLIFCTLSYTVAIIRL